MGAMQAGNVYRPTEDTRGRHRLLLADLADTVLQHAKVIMQGSPSGCLPLHEGCAVLCCAVLCCAVLCCAVPCRAFINFSYSYVLLSGNRCCRVWCGTILAKNMTSSLQTWQHAWNLCVCAIRSPCHWFEYRLALSQCAVQCCRVTRGMAAICDSPKSAVSRHSIVIHVFF